MTLDAARAVADAVLYEGYLLYPYRASAAKNRSRWQFGVLGPPGATPAAFAEPPGLSMTCLLSSPVRLPAVTIHLRFLQVQVREVRDVTGRPVPSLTVGGETFLSWDEAVEHEITMPLVASSAIEIPGGEDVEPIPEKSRIIRRRMPLSLSVRTTIEPDGDLLRLTITVTNDHPGEISDKSDAIRHSALGVHLLLEAADATFVSLMDPPPDAEDAAGRCHQNRCWPVLAGDDHLLLGAPIILYDHPKIAEQSPGELFDGTEIDEILTLRVMTMTDAEKAEARATDPRARTIVDRSDALTAEEFANLHGAWSVDPDQDGVLIDGVRVSKGSLVKVHPRRRADAQDLFFAGQTARVTRVISDVDGDTHVALVLADDPAADLHDQAGRYLYFAPDELEPLTEGGRAC
ncbi:hypothetical protein HH310_13920 [Actinoplanes sp. TBRC 11911]|uniref:hypothetical protein n=1 Tax=Actinoplanes sp. TBRC 11911 TaxID=2729386 RepID=UPI00145CFEC0|nr:hypothetical protein [Actinoplanes sp. TBRC 11911]NMO52290.1 hypothetical protein [Actinoplanes sp. TBRC 11911]